ncbi:MAG: S1-like domain-containing RNA-binding protein [Clostridia bacterium]
MKLEPGRYYDLKIIRIVSQGAYLNDGLGDSDNDVMLPIKQLPEGARAGDMVNVFIYRDSKDRLISTVRKPLLALGECGMLKVADTTGIGAFLDWGLEKDLFMPFEEQRGKVRKGSDVFVGLYIDKSGRLCATMDVYEMLRNDPPYKANDMVAGTVYTINEKIGVFIAVDKKYHGMIPADEPIQGIAYGDEVKARVREIRGDGKLILSIRNPAYMDIDKDADKIEEALAAGKGFLPFNDDSRPEDIKKKFSMSKSSFKRALGRLYKRGMIEITDRGIRSKTGPRKDG